MVEVGGARSKCLRGFSPLEKQALGTCHFLLPQTFPLDRDLNPHV